MCSSSRKGIFVKHIIYCSIGGSSAFITIESHVDFILDCFNPATFCLFSRPDLLDWRKVERMRVRERIDLAFHVMDREYGVTRLLDPEGKAYCTFETLQ